MASRSRMVHKSYPSGNHGQSGSSHRTKIFAPQGARSLKLSMLVTVSDMAGPMPGAHLVRLGVVGGAHVSPKLYLLVEEQTGRVHDTQPHLHATGEVGDDGSPTYGGIYPVSTASAEIVDHAAH